MFKDHFASRLTADKANYQLVLEEICGSYTEFLETVQNHPFELTIKEPEMLGKDLAESVTAIVNTDDKIKELIEKHLLMQE